MTRGIKTASGGTLKHFNYKFHNIKAFYNLSIFYDVRNN